MSDAGENRTAAVPLTRSRAGPLLRRILNKTKYTAH